MIAGVSTEFNPPGPEDFNLPPIFSGVEWFTKPVIDSYHTVWFELHEDLLATLGIERASEGQ